MTSIDTSAPACGDLSRRLEYHAELYSTNDRALEMAKSACPKLPLLVVAERQTAGRGRGGNRWWTGDGSLAFSLLLDGAACGERRRTLPLLGLAAGIAVVDAVKPLLGGRAVGLHWPNDVFADGQKLAGVLVEVPPGGNIVIGVGVNVNNSAAAAPPELQPAVATLCDLTGAAHDRTSLLIAILNSLQNCLATAAAEPEKLAAAAHALCLQKDRRLRLEWGQEIHEGLCRGIDRDGESCWRLRAAFGRFPQESSSRIKGECITVTNPLRTL